MYKTYFEKHNAKVDIRYSYYESLALKVIE